MQQHQEKFALLGLLAIALTIESVMGVITVQIGGATRLTSLNRQRDRYSCYWDCDLVGCQIARDDDECAYDCEKICRVRYDYAGRSGGPANVAGANSATGPQTESEELKPKTGAADTNELPTELLGVGSSVRLHLPRNASAKNFAIMDNCAQFS